MFVITGFSGTAPLTHGLVVFGMSQMIEKGFLYTVAKAGCLIFGTLFYAVSFPIRCLFLTDVGVRPDFPKADILGNSIYGAPI
jgi:hypothetical protein